MMFSKFVGALSAVAGALSQPLFERAATYNFSIYAYSSDTIHGYPVISINNTAYITSADVGTYTNGHNVTFDALSSHGNFTATIPGGGTPLFYVPSTSGPAGFTNDTDDDTLITSGFGLYGHVVFLQSGTSMMTEWYAIATDIDSLWQLSWDDTDGFPITLRSIAP
ncbi:hypothetical protein PFICI_04158 [Pestalotiopsis fici W106-1]|uniref:Uncharacterized protein n=1 Tax=Pestalotiopsis fici (strain W106-1 / CGMCC3.15140) TaxID=1229662 RepID=W3XJ95_PESFW|nr:uncharacterized protein PFICI_04158 [Pestalotiopsis fici W106-1]ETS86133.1 hypothetical protein PFICI_04158 [Pestalotiopsis fici W106-1]